MNLSACKNISQPETCTCFWGHTLNSAVCVHKVMHIWKKNAGVSLRVNQIVAFQTRAY